MCECAYSLWSSLSFPTPVMSVCLSECCLALELRGDVRTLCCVINVLQSSGVNLEVESPLVHCFELLILPQKCSIVNCLSFDSSG